MMATRRRRSRPLPTPATPVMIDVRMIGTINIFSRRRKMSAKNAKGAIQRARSLSGAILTMTPWAAAPSAAGASPSGATTDWITGRELENGARCGVFDARLPAANVSRHESLVRRRGAGAFDQPGEPLKPIGENRPHLGRIPLHRGLLHHLVDHGPLCSVKHAGTVLVPHRCVVVEVEDLVEGQLLHRFGSSGSPGSEKP